MQALYRPSEKIFQEAKLDEKSKSLNKLSNALTEQLAAIKDINSWTEYVLPDDKQKARGVLNELINSLYPRDDINAAGVGIKMAVSMPLTKKTPRDINDTPEKNPDQQAQAPQLTESTNARNYFRRDGDFWTVKFQNEQSSPMKHVDGLLYIAYLLNKPNVSIPCQQLVQSVSAGTAKTISEEQARAEGMKAGFKKQPISTTKERQIVKRKYEELQTKLESANMERQEEIKEELLRLEQYLSVKKRNFADPNDKKAQINVKKRIDKAYEVLTQAKMTDLRTHLEECVIPDDSYGRRYTGAFKWEIVIK